MSSGISLDISSNVVATLIGLKSCWRNSDDDTMLMFWREDDGWVRIVWARHSESESSIFHGGGSAQIFQCWTQIFHVGSAQICHRVVEPRSVMTSWATCVTACSHYLPSFLFTLGWKLPNKLRSLQSTLLASTHRQFSFGTCRENGRVVRDKIEKLELASETPALGRRQDGMMPDAREEHSFSTQHHHI